MKTQFFFLTLTTSIKNILFIFLLNALIGCERKTEDFKTEAITDYLPTQVGKFITYRVDSTVFTNLGRNEETHKYQIKHLVDAQILDNRGRPSFRIIRTRSDSSGTQPWVQDGTYFITPLADQVEVIEDNLRFIKLHLPFTFNFNWKGNRYLSLNPFSSKYSFDNDDFMNDWNYRYLQFDDSLTIGNKVVKNIFTLSHIDESINAPVSNLNAYASKSWSVEKYSKNIGLVYKEFILWEYQPNTSGSTGYKTGFGVKQWIINNN